MIYSRHSFIFPFVWENDYSGEEFFSFFSEDSVNNIWICTDTNVKNNSLLTVSAMNMEENSIEFDKYQYFNNLCRCLIFPDTDSGIVRSLCLKDEYRNDLKYIISAGDISYSLDINNVVLKVFSTGIAVISVNCSNNRYREIRSIKAINEYGRRLAMPYWKKSNDSSTKCADRLEISGKNFRAVDDFKSFKGGLVSLSYISTVIRDLLNRNGKNIVFRAKSTFRENEIRIKPIWDEKMFIACMITDKELVCRLCNDFTESDGDFLEENQRELTELINIDLQDHCSVLSKKERKKFLENCLYISQFGGEKPKLTAVTEHSYIKLLPEEDFDAKYFFDIYCQIIITALMQRMSIAVFRNGILEISKGSEKKGKRLTNKEIDRIMCLQERYVAFCNSCLFGEITQKREGQFIFSQLRNELDIVCENERLESQLNKLYELVNTAQGYAFNKWGLAISLIAIELNVITLIQAGKTFSQTAAALQDSIGVVIIALSAAVTTIMAVRKIFKQKNKGRK